MSNFLNVPEQGNARPRRRSLATPGALITIPDNDVPVDFGKDDDATLRKMIQKQNKRRGSCPINPQVRRSYLRLSLFRAVICLLYFIIRNKLNIIS